MRLPRCRARRRTESRAAGAVSWPLLLALCVLLSGCGVGFGSGERAGEAELVVTRDFGSEVLLEERVDDLVESDTVLRILDRHAEIETRYGGGFVQAIDGVSGGVEGGKPFDWLYFVNGLEADRGSAEVDVSSGDRIWWDHRNWSVTTSVPAIVGQFPAPFVNASGEPLGSVALECLPSGVSESCKITRAALESVGAMPREVGVRQSDEISTRIVVGVWDAIATEPIGELIAAGPERSGVYIRQQPASSTAEQGSSLVALDENAAPVFRLGAGVGLIAATRQGSEDAVWLVSGTDEAGLEAAAGALEPGRLGQRFAAVVSEGKVESIPMR